MARAIWSGAVSFGLVNVPVRLYTATDAKDVSFHQLDRETGERIRYKRVTAESGREVSYGDIVKGYEIEKGRHVVVEPEELDAVQPDKSQTIGIEDFVSLEEIDPIYFDKTYYLAPGTEGAAKKAYALLRDALRETGRIGIGRFVMRSKEYLAAIRATEDALVLETLYFADEVRSVKEVDDLPIDVEPNERELEMAEQLVGSLSSGWAPERYRDTHREAVLELIERKAEGQEIVTQPSAEPQAVEDLMDALQRSVEEAKQRRAAG